MKCSSSVRHSLLQVCSAGSRLLIQESVYDDVIARIKQRMSTLRLGHCLDKTIDMGAIVDESQRKSVDEMVQSARAEGAEVCLVVTSVLPSLS